MDSSSSDLLIVEEFTKEATIQLIAQRKFLDTKSEIHYANYEITLLIDGKLPQGINEEQSEDYRDIMDKVEIRLEEMKVLDIQRQKELKEASLKKTEEDRLKAIAQAEENERATFERLSKKFSTK
jgi:hypothetical protein